MRIGWIFKTESIIMPAVLDSIGGPGWLRGLLPLLNRFGQSVPPVIVHRRVRNLKFKRRGVIASSFLMGICFLLLASLFLYDFDAPEWVLPFLFLATYAVFFVATGINQLCLNSLHGKVIPIAKRGRLMIFSNVFGACGAVLFAIWLLGIWLTPDGGRFALIFGFAGICFLVATGLMFWIREHPDAAAKPGGKSSHIFSSALATLRSDRDFRLLSIAAASFGASMMLFPHYQAVARIKLDMGLTNLMTWVVVQNLGMALFGFPAGALADRFGNRLVLRCSMLLICGAPLLALALSHLGEFGKQNFFWVFLLIGLTPVTIRTFNNFTLELSNERNHPKYLSTLSLCMSVPIIAFSPVIGLMIDFVGFDFVFLMIVAIVLLGWSLTFFMNEPRHGNLNADELDALDS